LYAYYKQATVGRCTTKSPHFWDLVGKAKWNAWSSLINEKTDEAMSSDEAMEKYVDRVTELTPEWRTRLREGMPDKGGGAADDDDGEVNEDDLFESSDEERDTAREKAMQAAAVHNRAAGTGGGGAMGASQSRFSFEETELENEKKSICDLAAEDAVDAIAAGLRAATLNVDFRDGDGRSALHFAADRGHAALAKLLCDGVDATVAVIEDDGAAAAVATANSDAEKSSSSSCVKADIDAVDSDGATPLHYAALCEHVDVVAILVAAGADVNKKNGDGETAAEMSSDADVLAALAKKKS
jgi:acyl-CoA-binding protein